MKLPRSNSIAHPNGFSLVELLTALGIMAILAAIVMSGLQKVRIHSSKATATSNLRQVGTAVLSYANEHNGYLPGPCDLGIRANYVRSGSNKWGLAQYLAPYLNAPASETLPGGQTAWVEQLICPAAEQVVSDPEDPPPYYIQNYTLPIQLGRIFGAQAFGEREPIDGVQTSGFDGMGLHGDIWLLTNLDQQIVQDMPSGQVSASGWYSRLPSEPVWGTSRLRLYLDGSVSAVPLGTQ